MMPDRYPLADRDRDGWHADGDFEMRGGRLEWMTPRRFLDSVRPLAIDEVSRENIDDLRRHMQEGGVLDPLRHGPPGREDGRHRAHAAMELGIGLVPVLNFTHPDQRR